MTFTIRTTRGVMIKGRPHGSGETLRLSDVDALYIVRLGKAIFDLTKEEFDWLESRLLEIKDTDSREWQVLSQIMRTFIKSNEVQDG